MRNSGKRSVVVIDGIHNSNFCYCANGLEVTVHDLPVIKSIRSRYPLYCCYKPTGSLARLFCLMKSQSEQTDVLRFDRLSTEL